MFVVEDNAKVHNCEIAQHTRELLGIQRIFHPPCSPDLNPIEGCWSTLKRQIRRRWKETKTLQGLWKVAVEEWGNISQAEINERILGLERRRQQVWEVHGWHPGFKGQVNETTWTDVTPGSKSRARGAHR